MIQKFHAHVYFNLREKSSAEALYWAIQALLVPGIQLGKFHWEAVGPHFLPMFTVIFDLSQKNNLTQFLSRNREGLSILIHEDTGDDYRDHTQDVEWLGVPLPLNFEHFERIKNGKSALVFPE